MKKYKYKSFSPFNDHSNCKGHANSMLDSTYETEEERELLMKIISRLIKE